MPSVLTRTARFSRCKKYRYELGRSWDDGETVVFVGLNPSTADHTIDDPTVRRCIRFASDWGFGSLSIVNLFGYRSPDPSRLHTVVDPVGISTDRILREVLGKADLVIAAWGVHGTLAARNETVLAWIPQPHCLGVTRAGHPKHPLYLPATTEPRRFGH